MRNPFFSRRRLVVAVVSSLAIVVVAAGLHGRRSQAEELRERVAGQAVPTVRLVSAASVAAGVIELPARLEAWSQAPIHARISGYLKRWTVDIGGPVKAGQLLAEIETPEVEQQLLQARAEMASARSTATLAASTAKRWQALQAVNFVSQQAVDDKTGDHEAKQGVVNALQANVERVQSLKRDSRLVAPFDGVVTARNTDVGSLINAGGAPGTELFVISDLRRLRVYVNVPQRQVGAIRIGGEAQLVVPERPDRVYTATVQSVARAIQAGSGTMLVQLAVDNEAGELLSGSFATVRFDVGASPVSPAVGVPPSVLVMGKAGVQVATVDGEGRVRLKPVTITRDLGSVVEVAAGFEPGDRLIDSPPDGISTGDRVRVADTPSR